jgi:hypothetical protein
MTPEILEQAIAIRIAERALINALFDWERAESIDDVWRGCGGGIQSIEPEEFAAFKRSHLENLNLRIAALSAQLEAL